MYVKIEAMGNRKNTAQWAKYRNSKRLSRKYKFYVPKPQNSPTSRIIIEAPKKFSLIENRNEVIAYINSIFDKAKQGVFLQMNMGEIEYTDALTVTLVISLMMDARMESREKLKYIQVRTPNNHTEPARIFKGCHFDGTVTKGNADQNYFMSRTSSQVNQQFTSEIIEFAHSKGVTDANTMLNPLLVEMFSNTNNHATPFDETIRIPWFISIMEESDHLCFSVIDLGVGIYESLRSSAALQNIPQKEYNVVTDMYSNDQSRYLSTSIPKGVYSSTKLNYRGKGLKEIYDKATSSTTCNKFVIISNKAMVDVINIGTVKLDSGESFNGTAFYWEMKK